MPFWPLLTVNSVFLWVFKILIKITFVCLLLYIKAKTERKKKIVDPPKRAFLSFEIKTVKKCSSYFYFVLALKIIDSQMVGIYQPPFLVVENS